MTKRKQYEQRILPNGTMVERWEIVPPHRLTGINAYKPAHEVPDEWARVQELRKSKGLALGGRRVLPTDNSHIILNGGCGQQAKTRQRNPRNY